MKKGQWVDLTQGSILKALIQMALPLIAGSLLGVAYTVTDMFWVSRLGDRAVAAVGTGGMVLWFIQGISAITETGVSVQVGAFLGERRPWAARRAVGIGLLTAAVFGAVVALTLIFGASGITAFFKLNEVSTRQMAESYLRHVSWGMLFQMLAFVWASAFVAAGHSRVRMTMAVVGLGLNMILDPLCIFGFGWGAAGAAIATSFSMFISFAGYGLLARRYRLFRRLRVFPRWCRRGAWLREWLVMLRIGAPAGLQTMAFAGISMVISRLVASYGDLAVAAQRIGANAESISWATGAGFAAAVTAVTAQNRGAGRMDRVWQGFKATLLLSCLVGAVGTVLFGFFARPVTALFLSEGPAVAAGTDYFRIVAPSQILMIIELTAAAAFSGMGRTLLPSVIVITLTAARLPLVYWLTATPLGLSGIWLTISLSTCAKGAVIALWFFWDYRPGGRRRRLVGQTTD